MEPTLLQTWLRLPPGPWPPDHFTLLALEPSDAVPTKVEVRVMELMDVLRRHQLLHPELVTEGMNRLAQALICLTDPAERLHYERDQERRDSPPLAPAEAPSPAVNPAPATPAAPASAEAEPGSPPSVFDLDDDEADGTRPAESHEATQILEVPWAVDLEPPLTLNEESIVQMLTLTKPASTREVVEAVVARAPGESPSQTRRWLYRRLAVTRRCLRAWDALAPVLGNPDELLDRPAAVFSFLQAAVDLKGSLAALSGLLGKTRRHGGTTLAVVQQPSPSEIVRQLLPDQRVALALDWRRGRIVLEQELGRLRNLSREDRPRRPGLVFRHISHWLARNPEIILAVILAVALLVSQLRNTAGR